MKKWMLKAILQKTISFLPFSFKINYLFQKYITKAVRVNTTFFDELLYEGDKLIKELLIENKPFDELKIIELGTGWHPIIPILLFLAGAKKIISVDLNNHLRKENLIALINLFLLYEKENKLPKYVNANKITQLQAVLAKAEENSVNQILNQLNIKTKHGNILACSFEEKYDICFSINVLEHINENMLQPIVAKLYDITDAKAIHYHAFGSYDHFHHVDKNISKFNFLKYSTFCWKLIDNQIQPQNRWRVSQFKNLFLKENYSIYKELHLAPNLEELDKIKRHKDFKNIPKEICAIDYGVFVLKK